MKIIKMFDKNYSDLLQQKQQHRQYQHPSQQKYYHYMCQSYQQTPQQWGHQSTQQQLPNNENNNINISRIHKKCPARKLVSVGIKLKLIRRLLMLGKKI